MPGLLSSPLRNLLAGIAYLLVVACAATAAYIVQGWSASDAFFMVITTIFTVGYGEIRPLDTGMLRTVTTVLIVTGCTGMIFVTGALVQLITASQFQQILGVRRMQSELAALRGHVIICGYGRIGQMLARELRGGGLTSVVLERDVPRAMMVKSGFRLRADRVMNTLAASSGSTVASTRAWAMPAWASASSSVASASNASSPWDRASATRGTSRSSTTLVSPPPRSSRASICPMRP